MADTPDPGTGLTPKQATAVRESWAKLAADFQPVGQELFIRMFKAYPAIKAFFKQFDGMDWDDIRTSKKLRAHLINFKHSMTSYVDSLDDAEVLVILVQKTAASHHKRKIPPELFGDAFTTFIKLLKDSGTDEFTVAAWQTTLDTVAKVISAHVAELVKQ